MDKDRFDDLSKTLATNGWSRRRFAQRLGGGLIGAALTGLGLRQTVVAQGTSDGARWCREHFRGAAAGRCIAAAAQGGGVYYECGPGSDGSLKLCDSGCAECCEESDCPSGTCTDGRCFSETCDEQGLKPCGDDCIELTECCGGCPVGETCVEGTCQSQTPATCEEQGLKTCGDDCIAPTACCGNDDCSGGATCVDGTCEVLTSVTCTETSDCSDACLTRSTDKGDTVLCWCGTTIDGNPVCYDAMSGIGCTGGAGSCPNPNAEDGGCPAVYGDGSECISGFCTNPSQYCKSDGGCDDGYACVNRNLGCGGCDNYTGGLGICTPRCAAA